MENIVLYARICALTLLSGQLILLALRLFRCHNKKELFAFFLTLCYIGFKILFPDVLYLNEISTFLCIWALGNYLAIILEDKKRDTWNVVLFCTVGIYVLLLLLNLKDNKLFGFFYLFTAAVFFIYPLISFLKYYQRTKYYIFLYFSITSMAAVLSSGYEYLAGEYGLPLLNITIWIFILIFLGTLYMLSQHGYFLSTDLHSLYSRLNSQEKKLHQLYSKLDYTEHTLVVKDRFISLGLLAAGIIHEFKNILGLILNCAQFGQSKADITLKGQSLNLIIEHAKHGLESVIGLLERIKAKDIIKPESFSLKDFCNQFLKVMRANYRGAGINIVYKVKKDFRVCVRKVDFEQAMLNLVRNAAEALKSLDDRSEKNIEIELDVEENKGLVLIRDNAGGLPQNVAINIFEPYFKSGGSTGIGLYLTKMLAEQIEVQLIYEPIKKGSMFKFVFTEIENRNYAGDSS